MKMMYNRTTSEIEKFIFLSHYSSGRKVGIKWVTNSMLLRPTFKPIMCLFSVQGYKVIILYSLSSSKLVAHPYKDG